jgi:hypothetical protein
LGRNLEREKKKTPYARDAEVGHKSQNGGPCLGFVCSKMGKYISSNRSIATLNHSAMVWVPKKGAVYYF